MSLSREERSTLIEQYARGPGRLREALARVPREALQWRPAEGRWSAHEVVVHCADSETNAALRIRYLLAEPEPLIVGYDQEQWARQFDYHAQPLDDALAATDAARSRTVPLLRRDGRGRLGEGRAGTRSPAATPPQTGCASTRRTSRATRGQIERNVEAWKARSSSR